MSLGDVERLEYEEQFFQAVNFLSFELERAKSELKEVRDETKDLNVSEEREKRLQAEKMLERMSKEALQKHQHEMTLYREESEREIYALREEMSTMRRQTRDEQRQSVFDRMTGKTMGSWMNIGEDDNNYSYGVFFVFGTLKMILSERVRYDNQGTAMVRFYF